MTDAANPNAITPAAAESTLAELVERHARLGLNDTDIAAASGCSVSLLRRRFGKQLRQWRAQRRAMIRLRQWEHAKESPTVLNMLVREEFGKDSAKENRVARRDNDNGGNAKPWLDPKVG